MQVLKCSAINNNSHTQKSNSNMSFKALDMTKENAMSFLHANIASLAAEQASLNAARRNADAQEILALGEKLRTNDMHLQGVCNTLVNLVNKIGR